MSIEENKAIVQRWEDVVLGQRRLDLLDEVIHPDYILNEGEIRGRDAARDHFSNWLTQEPESESIRQDCIAEGDKVVTRWILTMRKIRLKGVSIYRISGGKIIEDFACVEEIK